MNNYDVAQIWLQNVLSGYINVLYMFPPFLLNLELKTNNIAVLCFGSLIFKLMGPSFVFEPVTTFLLVIYLTIREAFKFWTSSGIGKSCDHDEPLWLCILISGNFLAFCYLLFLGAFPLPYLPPSPQSPSHSFPIKSDHRITAPQKYDFKIIYWCR